MSGRLTGKAGDLHTLGEKIQAALKHRGVLSNLGTTHILPSSSEKAKGLLAGRLFLGGDDRSGSSYVIIVERSDEYSVRNGFDGSEAEEGEGA